MADVEVIYQHCDKCGRVTRWKNGKCTNHGWIKGGK